MVVRRPSPWIYQVLGVGRWRGRMFRVWEKRDEVVSLTRALPLILRYPHLVLRVCRDLVSICRAVPGNRAAFPYTALSWFVFEKDRLTLARLPYDHYGNGTQLAYHGTSAQMLWDLASRQDEIQRASERFRIVGQDRLLYFGKVLYTLLHRHLPYQGHPLFHYRRKVLVATCREFYTAERHPHLFVGSPELRSLVLRMAGLEGPSFQTIDSTLKELESQLDLDISRTRSLAGVPWQCGKRWG